VKKELRGRSVSPVCTGRTADAAGTTLAAQAGSLGGTRCGVAASSADTAIAERAALATRAAIATDGNADIGEGPKCRA
jgi:hypothetical protein